jgi:hypothetical protein
MAEFENFLISRDIIQPPRKIGIHKNSDPNGIRTRVAGVRGQCPRPLDDGTEKLNPVRRLSHGTFISLENFLMGFTTCEKV